MRLLRTSALVFALAAIGFSSLTGCGGDPPQNGETDAGVDAGVGDLEAYFSLQVGRCFEYTLQDSKQPIPDLGVAIEKIDTEQFKAEAPQGTYVVTYWQGFARMTDYVSLTEEGELKLHQRVFTGGKQFRYKPAITLLKAPIKGNDRIDSGEKVDVRVTADGSPIAMGEGYSVRVDTLDPTELRLPIGQTVEAYKMIVDETFTTETALKRSETRSFVPGDGDRTAAHGFVTIEFNFEPDETQPKKVYRLQNVRESSSKDGDICGSAP